MSTSAHYYWRLLATGFCFAMFGLGGLILSLTVFPVLYLCPMKPSVKQDIAQGLIHHTFQLFVSLMQNVGVLDLTLIGHERVRSGNHIVVANHPTLIDIVILISVMRRAACVIKEEVWRNPFMYAAVSAAGYIRNGDPQRVLNDCVNSVMEGNSLIVFPEGTRTVPGKDMKIRRGAANIAIRAHKNLTPVVIRCQPWALTKDKKWYEIPRESKVRITVRFFDDIEISAHLDDRGRNAVWARNLAKHMRSYFEGAMCG